jgi:TonB-dependent receptor
LKKHLFTSVAVPAILAVTPVMAETPSAPGASSSDSTPPTIQEVVVTGLRGSLRDALATKRAATGVVEVISAKDIGVLPDVTIAETLNTIPGVNTSRDRGNDSQAALGGLGPRLVLGLLNGREMASSEPDRNVRWEVFPSEVVSGVEVFKSSQADLITGGVAGTVDVQTIRPLEYSGPALTLRGGPVYYDGGKAFPGFDGLGYRFSGDYVIKLTPQLGWVIAASYQDQKNGYEDAQGGGWNYGPGNSPGPIVAGGPPVATPWGPSYEGKNIDTIRTSVASSLQWRPSGAFEARYDILFSREAISEHDNGAWISGWGNWGGSSTGDYTNTVVRDGALLKADLAPWMTTINSEVARYHQDMTLFATGGNAKWNLGEWQVVGDAAYSQAERYGLWQSVVLQNLGGAASYDYTGVPKVSVATSAWDAAQNGSLYAEGPNGAVSHLRDTLSSVNVDAKRNLNWGILSQIKFGVRATHREKDDAGGGPTAGGSAQATNNIPLPLTTTQYYNSAFSIWNPSAPGASEAPIPTSWVRPFNYRSLTAPTQIAGDYGQLVSAIYGPAVAAALSYNAANTPFTSHVRENVEDVYAMADYSTTLFGNPLTGNFGVHITHAQTTSHAPSSLNGAPPTEVSIGESYTKVLPSYNAKLDLGNGKYIKFGVAEVLSRPALNDLRADRNYYISGSPPYSGGGGNPQLKPYTADQVDLAFEDYFHKDGLISVNVFYKNVHDYIGYDTRTITIPGVTQPLNFTSPFNAKKDGSVEGVEFIFRTPFFFIPHLEKFGADANLALVNTDIHENSPVGHPFLMNGTAKVSGFFEVYYADDRLESRLGVKYHSAYTQLYGWDASASGLTAIRPETILDYSASYKITSMVTVRFQAGNLLNTALRSYDYNLPVLTDRNDYYGRRFLLDFTLKY